MNITTFWYKKNFLANALVPVALLYRAIMALRKLLYSRGYIKSHRFNIPVVIVGNLTVGGTGKTPLIIALANYLRQEGIQAGIVSRGYGGKAKNYPQTVHCESDPNEVGDEALLLYRQTGCPVAVAPRRAAAIQQLITKCSIDIVLCDDGLQHYALERDIEIAVLDGTRGLGNKLCLPAGPLRESPKRLNTVDFIIANEGEVHHHNYHMSLRPHKIYNLKDPQRDFPPSKHHLLHAIAGIGNPERFFNTLKKMELSFIPHDFPDHHQFTPSDLNFGENAQIIMTEKDAVKCEKFAHENMWVLSIQAELDPSFLQAFLKVLSAKRFNYGQV